MTSLLVLANKKLYVEEDPRIDIVEDMLPLANCGACGVPGCRQFAEALVQGEVLPGKCTVSNDDGRARIASFLGVDVGAEEKRVARVACQGGANVARNRAHYDGLRSCRAAAQVAGGGKGCVYGCLGLDDCCEACDFDAIHMNEQSLPVVDEDKCTACGDCVEACPKDLISLHPASHRLWVACRSLEEGDESARGLRGRLYGVRPLRDGCAGPDHHAGTTWRSSTTQGKHATRVPIERCPTGAIVWLDPGVRQHSRAPPPRRSSARRHWGDAPT